MEKKKKKLILLRGRVYKCVRVCVWEENYIMYEGKGVESETTWVQIKYIVPQSSIKYYIIARPLYNEK